MDSQPSTSENTAPDQVHKVTSIDNTKKESLIKPKKHYISETSDPTNVFPKDKYLDLNDICENPDLETETKPAKNGGPERRVQINKLAYDRVEYLSAIIKLADIGKKWKAMSVPANKKFERLKEENDHAGHLLAAKLGGEGDEYNVIPQNANINLGNWKTMEHQIVKDVEEYQSVTFTVRVIYDDKPRELLKTRPKEFLFKVETLNNELIRYGKVENPPNEFVEFKFKFQKFLIKNFKKIWNDSNYKHKLVLSLEENILSEILFSENLTQNEYFIWQVIYEWVKIDEQIRIKCLPKYINNFFKFKTLSDYFIDVFISNCALVKKFDKARVIYENLKLEYYQKDNVKGKGKTTSLESSFKNLKITNDWENSVALFKSQKYYSNLHSLKKILICGSCKTNHFEIFNSGNIWKSFQISSLKKWGFSIFSISPEICTANNNCNCLASISCELYENKKWSEIEIIKNDRKYASIVVHNNCIYIAGGINSEGSVEKTVKKYDLKNKQKLTSIKPMITARRNFSLVLYKNRLWAIGGIDDNLPLSSVESYDFDNNVWLEEKSLNDTRYNHAAIEFEGELYVVGGLGQKDDLVVERYQDNTEPNHWVLSSKLNKAIPNPHLVILAYP